MKRLLIVILFLPMLASATTYYVDCNASDDTGLGTSTGTAWKTIAKVNSSSFSAGDSILFNKGCTWREQLTVPSSGSAGNVITFGAYGTGAKPIITGADVFSSFTTESSSTGAYVTLNASSKVVTTPNTVANELTGLTAFRLEVDVALTSYANGVNNQVLIAKDMASGGNNQRHWNLYVDTGGLLKVEVFNGSGGFHAFQVTHGLTNGVRYKLRADVTCNDGAGNSNVKFYKSTDGITYTQIGSTQTWASNLIVLNSTNNDNVAIGRSTDAYNAANGNFYRARIWTDLGTTLLLDANLNDYVSGTTWTAPTGEVWTLTGSPTVTGASSIYYAAPGATPNQAFRDGALLALSANKTSLASGKWWWDSVNSRAYVFDNPSGHTIELAQRNYAISNAKDYVTVTGLNLQAGNLASITSTGGHATIQNNTVFGGGTAGGISFSGDSADVSGNTVSYTNSNGIATGNGTTNSLIYSNDVSYCCQTVNDRSGISVYGTGTYGNKVYSNYAHDNGLAFDNVRGIIIDTVTGGVNEAYYNRVYNNPAGIAVFQSAGQKVYYNVVWDGTATSLQDGIYSNANASETDANLFYGNTVWTSKLIACYETNNSGSNIFKNNICYLTNASGVGFFTQGSLADTQAWDYNLVYTTNATNLYTWNGNNYSTRAAFYGATGQGQHDVSADPKFTNAAGGDFTLQPTSPAIGTGANLGATYNQALNPTSSFPWTLVTQCPAWNIGAFGQADCNNALWFAIP